MKILKLNRRWRQYKESGHTACFRFDGFTQDAQAIERALRSLCNCGGYDRRGDWYGYYGKPVYKNGYSHNRPYFVTVRTEELATMALLKAGV